MLRGYKLLCNTYKSALRSASENRIIPTAGKFVVFDLQIPEDVGISYSRIRIYKNPFIFLI